MLIRWGWEQHTSYDFEAENCSWVYKIIDLADKAGVKLAGPPKFEEDLEKIRSQKTEMAEKMKRWDSVNWPAKLKSYGSKYDLGGKHYDITMMSAAERKKCSLDGGGGWGIF
ncbi:hypothetical protein FALBO_17463 [Fusarium albosuccineum]|uniref:Uncharacterized protein n=1 Tax=Fusarium albosuccineum TaxID=1237068 RepID=A0A8H4NHG8_9HYPO|nr:hypothetical protein FALBO_17463 [Fusarium albosuccineum]